jgi:hypothetical protein
VVVNERTGTIVMGRDVHISPVAILHGNLTVEIQTSLDTLPLPSLAGATPAAVAKTVVDAKEEPARSVLLKQGATVEELVRALAAIGSTPRDVIAILQNLRAAAVGSAVGSARLGTFEPPAARPPKTIEAAAKQFEALMIAQLLKEARGSEGGWLGSGEDSGNATAAELAEEQFAQALAANGGLGLSKQIVASLSAREK